jgi:hypothetical protein
VISRTTREAAIWNIFHEGMRSGRHDSRRLTLPLSCLALLSGLAPLLVGLALLMVGCASHTLMPKEQASAIEAHVQALVPHTRAIQTSIRESGSLGGLAFLDAAKGGLVVLPGDDPWDAWQRRAAPAAGADPVSVPEVITFVYRADVPKAPETVARSALERQAALRTSLTALADELRDAHRRTEERLDLVRRELAESIAATKQEADSSVAAARADIQNSLSSLADDLESARKFMLQTAQLGWLNQELGAENASGIRKVASASQDLAANSAKLASAMRQLSDTLAAQLKDLATRLDAIQGLVANTK